MSKPRAIVTGAARGIGRAIVLELVRADHQVMAVDLDTSRLETLVLDHPDAVTAIELDVTDEVAVEDVVAQQAGVLDVLVNNAGIGSDHPFYDTTTEQWRKVLELDLTAAFMLTRGCWDLLRKPGASVVNISSIHGSRPLAGQAAYAAAKGGLENLTRAMALDAAPFGVRVNAVAPGFVRTRSWPEWIPGVGDQEPAYEAWTQHTIPAGRMGEGTDVAGVVTWLAQPSSAYVSGAVIAVDGALAARAYPPKEQT